MKKHTNGVLVLVVMACLFLATRPPVKQSTGDVPTLAVLADIIEAFAYNIEQDGTSNEPRLTHTAHVGQVFDDFGKRSTLGQSYRSTFADVFLRLSVELQTALDLDEQPGPLPLTIERRKAVVETLRLFSRRLKDGEI